ncbi:MAG: prolyl oligopeptidase family serine peptidase, partial [Micromonosporaceae bacterium]|nr:prolyl oligopeptidase family serine peptidase [Micromonosporaceae bacterium]
MTRRLTLDDLYAIEVPAQPAIAPDGSSVLYVLRTADRDADQNHTTIWRVATSGDPVGQQPEQLTRGTADSAPAWSPDGTRIAFLRTTGAAAQVWLLPAGGGEPEQLTSLPAGAGAPVWSPDGTRIAFAAPVDLAAAGGEDDAARERRAAAPVVTDRLGYKADGAGLLRRIRQHLVVVEVGTGRTRRLTSGDWHAGQPAWSPDGARIAFSAAMSADADLTGESAAYVVDTRAEAPVPRLVGPRHGQAGPAGWLPDGSALLVAGRTDTAVGHHRLLRIDLAGAATVDLTERLDRNLMPGIPGYPGGLPQVGADGSTVLFCARDRGCTHLYAVPAGGGRPRRVLGGPDRVVSGLSVAARARVAAVVVAGPESYGDLVVVDLTTGAERRLARYAPDGVALLRPQERRFRGPDGTEVHGWLLRDPDAPTPAPLLLDIHGGPHNAWSPVPDPGHLYHQLLAARGWAVLTLNPRGSDGYGEAFLTAALGAWGLADEPDLLAPVDQLVAEGVADPARLAVAGYSYGGYLTCWLTGRTDRFAAAVAGGTVADLTSISGTSDVGTHLNRLENGALPYQDPPRLAAQSPYPRVDRVVTPTLLLHGGQDERCPVGQAEQWFAALRSRQVPARLVVYPQASHLFILDGRPSHRADYSRRIVDWVTQHTR